MVRIKDIAEKSEVSSSTVSRILSGDKSLSVSEETRTRVEHVAEKLGYKKKYRRPGKNNRKKVGIMMWHSWAEESEDSYYLGIRKSIEKNIVKAGYNPVLLYRNEHQAIDTPELNLDGIIAIGKFSRDELYNFQKGSRNLVIADSCSSFKEADSVSVDLKEMTLEVLTRMTKDGHTDIGFIGGKETKGNPRTAFTDLREDTYLSYMKSLGINEDSLAFASENFSMTSGYAMMKKIIEERGYNLPTAFFIASDYLAVGALKALGEKEIKVPEEVKIISVDNLEFSSFSTPSLTTVDIPVDEMGETAVTLLLERIKGRTYSKRVFLFHKIIYRDSYPVK